MDMIIQGIIKGMTDIGCKFVKNDLDKLYFEIPNTISDKQIQLAKK